MKPKLLAIALLTLFGQACGIEPRVEYALTDPAILDDCPRSIESPGDLPFRVVWRIPAGTVVTDEMGHQFVLEEARQFVPLEQVNARETMLVRGALAFRGGYTDCRSVVIYVEDRDRDLAERSD